MHSESTMREHLKKLFTHAAGKLVKSAMRDTSAAANFRKLAELHKSANDDETGDGAIFAALCDLHEQSAADATELAGHFSECLKELHKAAGFVDDLDALMPTQVSAVVPSNLRPVIRAGQREISQFSPLDKTDRAADVIAKITQLD